MRKLYIAVLCACFTQTALAGDNPRSIKYSVPLIAQKTPLSCWAAAMAMILSWKLESQVLPDEIAQRSGYKKEYINGLDPNDKKIFEQWGFATEAPQTYTIEGFYRLLRDHGPLWVAAATPRGHVRVVTGFVADPDPDKALVFINDPWDHGKMGFELPNSGSQYTESYREYVASNEDLGNILMGEYFPTYVAYLKK